ncbi:hypothetical protein Nepgr_013956 [Nepenthes gracilis]|uniref:Methyltransferase type 11 domain-containing protein n=1 Tax=Nepenthes gracilis TaxID=150966 RepID=A0AAD3SJS3_NEPGR|nr:hypothetical protein Nepgr_013956 [Nepenthes gracilis]
MAFCSPTNAKLNNICIASSLAALNANGGARSRRRGTSAVQMAASDIARRGARSLPEYEEGPLERPRWAGETPLSRLVGALISFQPIYSILKLGAREVLISTAEKTNIPWREMTREMLESEVYKEMDSILNPSIIYPDYYLKPFHAYDEGNLSWLAAAEAEAATMSMVRRAIPEASSLDEANEIVRGNWLQAIEQHHQQYSRDSTMRDILDVGCSVGVSTRFLANKFHSAKVTGLDLSPYFLAVAQFKEKDGAARDKSISWIHANGENTGLPSQSFDLVSISYVLHECPATATVNLVREAFRLLRPGGTIAITDNSPKSKILQELSPVLFTLMKSTEPFLDEYYLLDLEGVMREAGFINVQTLLTDPRHRTVTGTVPH